MRMPALSFVFFLFLFVFLNIPSMIQAPSEYEGKSVTVAFADQLPE
jgi:hypothetical protein